MTTRAGVLVVAGLLVLAGVFLVVGCTGRAGPTPPCDDVIRPAVDVPAPTRHRLDAAGVTGVVGSGAIWFIAPHATRWSAVVERDGGRAWAKLPLWVDDDGELPDIAVHRDDGGAAGAVEATPTAEGLPGPVPSTATFPTAGCWTVIADGGPGRGTATVTIRVRG